MYVYIVEDGDSEGRYVVAVFADEASAQAYVEAAKGPYSYDGYTICRWEVQ